MERSTRQVFLQLRMAFICSAVVLCLAMAAPAMAKSNGSHPAAKWWQVTPEPEVPSTGYDSILYSEIAPKLREIQKNSDNRIRV